MNAPPQEQPCKEVPAHTYNKVFEQLVDKAAPEEQLVGLVAYGLYKIAKREWVVDYVSTNGEKPDQIAHDAYAKGQTTTILDGYRSQATEIVASYANDVVNSERPTIQRDALKGTFGKAVWSSFVGSLAFALVVAALAFVVAISGTGLPIQISLPSLNHETAPEPIVGAPTS